MELNEKNVKKILMIIACSLLLYACLLNMKTVLSGIGSVFEKLSPFVIGLSIAFILNVLLNLVEKVWDLVPFRRDGRIRKKLKRPICLILSILIISGVIAFVICMLLPELGRTISLIADQMPTYIEKISKFTQSLSEKYGLNPAFEINWESVEKGISTFLSNWGKRIFDSTINMTSSIFSAAVNTVLGFVFSLYVLLQKEVLNIQIRKLMYAYLPNRWTAEILRVAKVSNSIFSKFVTGQLTEAVIIGILCFIGTNLLSIPYAGMVATLVGFTALIPVFGAFIGTVVGALMIVMVDPMMALRFIIFIIVLQQFEGKLIYPKVVGKSIGLPGIWVLVAVTLGGTSFGMLGMLISVPTCSVLYTLLGLSANKRLEKKGIRVLDDSVESTTETEESQSDPDSTETGDQADSSQTNPQ